MNFCLDNGVHYTVEGQKETADKICNIYGERDHEFLRNIFKENNP
jgi:hypothetical protein